MSQANLLLGDGRRMASELRTRGGVEEHYQRMSPAALGAHPRMVARYLRTTVGADLTDLSVDGSVTPATFELAPASDEVIRIQRLLLLIVSPTTPTMPKFGDLVALTNGITIEHRDATGLVLDLLDGVALRSHSAMAINWSVGLADLTVSAAWDLPAPVRLDGGVEGYLRATVRDNLSALTLVRLMAEGCEESDIA